MRKLLSKMYRSFLVAQIMTAAVGMAASTIDGLVIGNCLGASALGAVGIIYPMSLLPIAIGSVLTMGLYNKVSESVGSKDYLLAGRQLRTVLVASSVIFVPVVLFSEAFAQPICSFLCGSADALLCGYAIDYLVGLAPSLLFSVSLPVFIYTCQMNNLSFWCMVATGTMLAVNIFGDLFVVMFTDWGMLGIGAASSISALVALLVIAPMALKKTNALRPQGAFDPKESLGVLLEIVKFGAPSAITSISASLSGMFMNSVMASAGFIVFIAANTAAIAVFDILYLFRNSLWYCTSIVSSTLMGRRMYNALKQIPAVFFRFVLLGALVSGAIGFVFAEALTSLFLNGNAEVQEVAVTGLRILTLNLFFNALVTCFQSLFRATGHRFIAVALPAIYFLGFYCPLAYLLINTIGPLGFFVARVGAYSMGVLLVVVFCCVKNGFKPFSPETYLLLPENEPGTFDEIDVIVEKPDRIKESVDKVVAFYEKNGAPDTERRCITIAYNELIQGICLKDEVENVKKGRANEEAVLLCWVHASNIDGVLSVLTINAHGNASDYFISELVDQTRTPLERHAITKSTMPLFIEGELSYVDSVYVDFLTQASIEIKMEKEQSL